MRLALGALALSLASSGVFAQEGELPFDVQSGPITGELGKARLDVPAGLGYLDRANTRKLLEASQNVPSGAEVGGVWSDDGWFVIFTYEESGHVKDEDKDELDADDLLDTLKEQNEAGNDMRKSRGWDPIELVGWHKPPFYDPKTNNLTWATLVRSSSGQTINWSTKLLGRTGTMHVDLVVDPQQIAAAAPEFDSLMSSFTYVDGQKYNEFKEGDKVAEYGLVALVAGGAGVFAAKTGLIAKFWKLLIIPIVAIGAFFKRLFGGGKKEASEASL
jgi:uncharacterized membrane-anchored protein